MRNISFSGPKKKRRETSVSLLYSYRTHDAWDRDILKVSNTLKLICINKN